MMFSDLSIGKTQDFKKYLNKYDVIHIDIQWFLANCEDKKKVVQFITKKRTGRVARNLSRVFGSPRRFFV